MENSEMWSMIVGFFLPIGIAVVQKEKWSVEVRTILSFVLCLLAGMGTVYFTGGWKEGSVSALLLVLVTSISTYKGLWQPSGIAGKIEKNILG